MVISSLHNQIRVIKNIKELKENIKTFDKYMANGGADREFLLNLINIGKCFIVVNEDNEKKFYPSKFIGYQGITIEKYDPYSMDGRDTNMAINKILKCKCQKDIAMTDEFVDFCVNLGLKGKENKKFWLNQIYM